MDVSIVIPLFNEEESLPELLAWIERVVNANQLSYEVILIVCGHFFSYRAKYLIMAKIFELNLTS
jgi:glycosyltransferase involved in cell wall biosynthesis